MAAKVNFFPVENGDMTLVKFESGAAGPGRGNGAAGCPVAPSRQSFGPGPSLAPVRVADQATAAVAAPTRAVVRASRRLRVAMGTWR